MSRAWTAAGSGAGSGAGSTSSGVAVAVAAPLAEAGTVTPLHHDACNLVVAQIRGRKQFRLIPATQWALLYDDDGFFSSVDVDKLLPGRSPGAQNISPLDAVLNPGEILFIPAGWSHHVRALDPSISVSATNFVFPNPRTW